MNENDILKETNKIKGLAVLLATYNGANYLQQQLESIKQQSCQDFVCFIHDDGSTDESNQIIEDWIQTYPQQFRKLEGPSQGSAKDNFMWMLSQVEAECYMLSDQDDVWLPEKIQKTVDGLQTAKQQVGGPCLAFSDMYVVDQDLQILDNSFIRYIGRSCERIKLSQILVDNPAAGCTMAFDRELRDLAIQLVDATKVEMHDVWILSLAAAFGEGHVRALDEPLVLYRQHGNNEMGASRESIVDKLWRNISGVFTGKMLKEKKDFIQQARDLAGQLSQIEKLPEEQKEFLLEFSQIGNKNKLKRIAFYRKNDISRLRRTKWMYLWV